MCGSETVYGKAVVTGDNVVFKQDASKKLQSIDGTHVELDSSETDKMIEDHVTGKDKELILLNTILYEDPEEDNDEEQRRIQQQIRNGLLG